MKLVKFNFADWVYGGMKDAYLETGQPVKLKIMHEGDEMPLFRGRIDFDENHIMFHWFELDGTPCEKLLNGVTDLMMGVEKDA
jgi:hypothetical protein